MLFGICFHALGEVTMSKVNNHLRNLSILVSVSLILVACGQNNRQASPDIKNSFSTAASPSQKEANVRVAIKTAALDKDFLLQGNLIIQDMVPMFNGLKSRVVHFEVLGDKLAMYESAEGQTLSSSHPPKLLLAVFRILERTADEIAFDFADGMSKLFLAGDWYASDFAGGEYFPQFDYLPVTTSVIRKVNYLSNSTMALYQIAQLPAGLTYTNTIEVVYYLSPYQKNPGFTPSKTTDFDRMGFFEVAPQLTRDEEMVVYATKWDARKKIKYGISASTPEEYKQAVKDGVLYWNQILGEDAIEVVETTDVQGPNASINMIEWVKWDYAGFAYADAQMDPLTGEILHSQIFLTSAFAFGGKDRAKMILAKQNEPQALKTKLSGYGTKNLKADKQSLLAFQRHQGVKKKKVFGLKNFTQNHLCYRDESPRLMKAINNVLAKNLSDEKTLSIAQDYVREVVAHEVGHTLGLRHNFAGNLSANYSLAERSHLLDKYLQNGEVDADIETSSSVMEYQEFEESIFTGDKIERRNGALPYDQKAIAALYRGETAKNYDIPLFCTDTHMIAGYVDCTPFDVGSSPLAFEKNEVVKSPDNLAELLAGIFISIRTHPQAVEVGMDFEDLFFTTDDLAGYLSAPKLGVAITMLYDLFPYLSIERKFAHMSPFYMPEFLKLSKDYISNEVNFNGGMVDVIPNVPSDLAQQIYAKTFAILNNPAAVEALNYSDQAYQFSSADQAKLAAVMNRLTDNLESLSLGWEIYLFSILERALAEIPSEAGPQFEGVYAAKLNRYLTASTSKIEMGKTKIKMLSGGTKQVLVSLPVFEYSRSFRRLAATGFRAIGSNYGSANASQATAEAAESLKAIATKALGGLDPLKVDAASIKDPRLAGWVLDVTGILTDLTQDTFSMDGSL